MRARVTMVPGREVPSKAVKALADSTEPRPRRSRTSYSARNWVESKVRLPAPKRCLVFKTPSKQKPGDASHSKVPSGRVPNPKPPVSPLPVKPEMKHRKRKTPRAAVTKLKKAKPTPVDPGGSKEECLQRKESTEEGRQQLNGGNKERMLMREWLEVEADGGNIPGLKWFDQKEKLIRITWRHGSRAEWSTDDVTVFKCWAQHTGRYSCTRLDYKRWKANFRCALNSLQDVEEVKDKRSTKTQDPYKVYKLLKAIPPKKHRRESVKSTQSSSADNISVATEEVIQADRLGGNTVQPADSMTQELFLHPTPQPDSSGFEQVLAWSVNNGVPIGVQAAEVENLVRFDPSLTCLDHCYISVDNVIQPLQQVLLPPSPPPPAPFNNAIPVPVQDLIENSEEFQTMMPVSETFLNFSDVNIGEFLGFGEIQASAISSTNDNLSNQLLESIFQVYLSQPT